MSFNPLNQVYVFNRHADGARFADRMGTRFNPLNQVYVFNRLSRAAANKEVYMVLIP